MLTLVFTKWVAAAMGGALAAFVFVRSKERYYQYKAELWEERCGSIERELTATAKCLAATDAEIGKLSVEGGRIREELAALQEELRLLVRDGKADPRLGGPS